MCLMQNTFSIFLLLFISQTLPPFHLVGGEERRGKRSMMIIIITIVRSYTGKYHEFVAVCIVTSAQHE